MGLADLILVAAFGGPPPTATSIWRIGARAAGVLLIAFHLVLAPLSKPLGARFLKMMGKLFSF